MKTLQDRLDEVDRKLIVDDVAELIDQEVGDKGGLTGMALKAGYKAVSQMRNGRMIHDAVDAMLDDFTESLNPMYADYRQDDQYSSFEDYLTDHDDRAVEALLSVTDRRADDADQKFLKKTYNKLRGQAEHHVEEALPRVGQLIDKHAPKK